MEQQINNLLVALSTALYELGLEYEANIIEGYVSIQFSYRSRDYGISAILQSQDTLDRDLIEIQGISDHLHAAAKNADGVITQLVEL